MNVDGTPIWRHLDLWYTQTLKKIAIETHHQKHEITLQSFKYPDYSYSCHQRSYFRQIDKERSVNNLSLDYY